MGHKQSHLQFFLNSPQSILPCGEWGDEQNYKYVYTADGIRTNKIVNGTNHIYTWCWKVIINMIREQWEEIFEYEFS